MGRSARGALAGAIAGVLAVTLMLRGTLTAGFPVVALALWERALRLMPMEVFGFLIVRLKFLAKPLAFWGVGAPPAAPPLLLAPPVPVCGAGPARRRAGDAADPEDGDVSRRELLRRSLVLAFGVLAGSALGRWLGAAGGGTAAYAQEFFSRGRGLPPAVTPTHPFYVVSKNPP